MSQDLSVISGAGPIVRFGRTEQTTHHGIVWVIYEALERDDWQGGNPVAWFVRHVDALAFMQAVDPPQARGEPISKPTCRELLDRHNWLDAVELKARVEAVLRLIDEIEPPGLGLHTDEPECSLCQVKVELKRRLNGERE